MTGDGNKPKWNDPNHVPAFRLFSSVPYCLRTRAQRSTHNGRQVQDHGVSQADKFRRYPPFVNLSRGHAPCRRDTGRASRLAYPPRLSVSSKLSCNSILPISWKGGVSVPFSAGSWASVSTSSASYCYFGPRHHQKSRPSSQRPSWLSKWAPVSQCPRSLGLLVLAPGRRFLATDAGAALRLGRPAPPWPWVRRPLEAALAQAGCSSG